MTTAIQWEWTNVNNNVLMAANPFKKSSKKNAKETRDQLKHHHQRGRNHPVTIHVQEEEQTEAYSFPDVGAALEALEVRVFGENYVQRLTSIRELLNDASLALHNAHSSFTQSQDPLVAVDTAAADGAVAHQDAERALNEASTLRTDAEKIVEELQNILRGAPAVTMKQDITFLEKTLNDATGIVDESKVIAKDAQKLMSDMNTAKNNFVGMLKKMVGSG
jgi:hypothetical protein